MFQRFFGEKKKNNFSYPKRIQNIKFRYMEAGIKEIKVNGAISR